MPSDSIRRTPFNILKVLWYGIFSRWPSSTISLYNLKLRATPSRMLERAYIRKGYEERDIEILTYIFPRGGFFLDVGANCGIYSIYVAVNLGAQHVVAVEPSTRELTTLTTNISLNSCENIIDIIPYACSNSLREEPLLIASERYSGANALQEFYYNDTPLERYQKVTVSTIDQIASILSRLDCIKIDVEGHDFETIQGAIETLNRFHPNLFIEYPQSKTLDLLFELGYKSYHEENMYNTLLYVGEEQPWMHRKS